MALNMAMIAKVSVSRLLHFSTIKKYAISYQQHAVERIRQLFAQVLSYPLPKEKGDYGIARHFISADSIEPYVIFFHSTTRDEKHWPEQEWRNLIEKLTALSVQVRLPWGNEKEKARAERLAKGLSHVVVLPKLSLRELAGQIANAKAVVSVGYGSCPLKLLRWINRILRFMAQLIRP